MAKNVLPAVAYHMAEAANWESIQRCGLLSTSKLLDAASVSQAERTRIESAWRPGHTRLPSGVEVRDQRPMPPAALERCLVGMKPAEWYRLINARVFFWFDFERLNRQRRACSHREQVVLVIDVEQLVARHASRIAVTPINSGNARRCPATRGRATFVPYRSFVESGWSSEAGALGTRPRSTSHRPVELTVLDGVPDVASLLVRTVRLRPSQPFTPDPSGEALAAARL
jgi:hypothetical protein